MDGPAAAPTPRTPGRTPRTPGRNPPANPLAEQVRSERQANEQFILQQRARFRERGAALREERHATQEAIADSTQLCRRQAATTGARQRNHQAALRLRRRDQERTWEEHGRELTQKYSTSGNQEMVRQLKQEIAEERERKATEMKKLLKRLKKETDDGIYEVNCERVRRVYAETAHPVVRTSKQNVYVSRCHQAHDVRLRVAEWKRAKEENALSFLSHADSILEGRGKGSRAEREAVAEQRRHEERQLRRQEAERRAAERAALARMEMLERRERLAAGEDVEAEDDDADGEGMMSERGNDMLGMLVRVFGIGSRTKAEAPIMSVRV